ncbi:Universal stress protein A [Serratia entomophila]|nr:Universal stress protein A [Serratia entomophila]
MGYHNVLVTVAVAADSHRLVEKAVSIVRPSEGKLTLLSTIANPEMYNNFAGPMLGDLRALMEEETRLFLEELRQRAGYPIADMLIVHGELADSLNYASSRQPAAVRSGGLRQSQRQHDEQVFLLRRALYQRQPH